MPRRNLPTYIQTSKQLSKQLSKQIPNRLPNWLPTVKELRTNADIPDTRNNRIFQSYFVDKITGSQIANNLGVSKQRVFQILNKHPEYKNNKIYGNNVPSDEILFDLYFVKMISITKIARQFRTTNREISAAIKRLPNYEEGMEFRGLKILTAPHKTLPSTNELFRLYTEEGLNTVQIAKKFKVGQSLVYLYIKKHPRWVRRPKNFP